MHCFICREWQRYRDISLAVEKTALLDEDCLLDLNIINREIYTKIKSANSSSSMDRAPFPAKSALVKWLGVDSLQTLREIQNLLQNTESNRDNPTQSRSDLNDDDSTVMEDDGWEKEDIDEIQGKACLYEYIAHYSLVLFQAKGCHTMMFMKEFTIPKIQLHLTIFMG